MSSTNWNFSNNLSIPNNMYLKYLDTTGITKHNILGLDSSDNINLNSATGDIYMNSNNSGSNTFLNVSNSRNVLVNSKLAVGINSTSNLSSNIILPLNGWIGLNSTQGGHTGYLGLAASSSLLNTSGSRVLLYGIDAGGDAGSLNMYSGNVGSVKMFTGNDSMRFQILNSGDTNFQPNGSTIRLSITDNNTTLTNPLIITSTAISTSTTTGALQVYGGIGIDGDLYLNGSLNVDSVTGNINFTSSAVSTSYTSGATYFVGGVGIQCSTPAVNQFNGGGLSVAGGFALGHNAMLGGNITVFDSSVSTSAITGSGIFYGGVGINGQFNARSDNASQIKITPVSNGNETSLYFGNQNNYTTIGSWTVGQNINAIGSGGFGIASANDGTFIKLDTTITLNKFTKILNTLNLENDSINDLIIFNSTQGNSQWSMGRIINNTTGDFHISRFTQGTLINYLLTADVKTGDIRVFGTENAISTSSGGSFRISGGASIAKDIYIGGSINSSNSIFTNISSTNLITTNTTISTGTLNVIQGSISIVTTSESTGRINQFTTVTNGSASLYNGISNPIVNFYYGIDGSGFAAYESNSVLMGTWTNHPFSLLTGNTRRLYIATSGNIGINNNSPAYTLDVNGTVNISTSLTTGALYSTNLITNIATIPNSVFTNISSGTVTALSSTIPNSVFTNISSGTITATSSTIPNSVFTNISTGSMNSTNLIITNFSTANLNAYGTINTIGNIFTTGGNVGIKSTAPSSLLHVSGSLQCGNSIGGAFKFTDDTNPYAYYGSLLVNGSVGDARLNIQDRLSNLLSFYSGITKIGGFGISTSSLPGTLTVTTNISSSALYTTNQTTTNSVFTNITTTNLISTFSTMSNSISTNISVSNLITNNATISTGSLTLNQANLIINVTNGSVGRINQTSTITNGSTSLYNSISNPIVNFYYGIDGSGFAAYESNSVLMGTWTNNPFSFTTGAQRRMYIATSGNIGINNNSPAYKLDVNGTARFTNVLSAIFNSNTLGNIFTTGGNVGINNTKANQMLEISPITYAINQDGGFRVSTSDFINTSDVSYRYIDVRLKSDGSSNYRGAIIGTLNGGIASEYEYMSFNQQGTISINGISIFSDVTPSNNSTTGAVRISTGGLSINSSFNSTSSSNGGSLTVNGGAAISQDVYIGGDLTISGEIIYEFGASSTLTTLTITSTKESTNQTSGAVIVAGGISIQATRNATSSTAGGGITVVGGVGINQDLYVGGTTNSTTFVSTDTSISNSTITNLITTNTTISTGSLTLNQANLIINVTNGSVGRIVQSSNVTNGSTSLYNGISNPIVNFYYGIDGAGFAAYEPNSVLMGTWTNHPFTLMTGNTRRMYIATSGNIGVNNNSPAHTLDVNGTFNLSSTNISENSTSGAFISAGGISISKTSNSTSTTAGGALSIAGGMSVFKDVYVGGTVTSSSDKFLKKNIKPLPSILDKISNINPITYNSINDSDTKDYIGFIAQDFENIFPELIRRENDNAYYSLAYDRITALNFKCIKELLDEINKLKIIIKSLQN